MAGLGSKTARFQHADKFMHHVHIAFASDDRVLTRRIEEGIALARRHKLVEHFDHVRHRKANFNDQVRCLDVVPSCRRIGRIPDETVVAFPAGVRHKISTADMLRIQIGEFVFTNGYVYKDSPLRGEKMAMSFFQGLDVL